MKNGLWYRYDFSKESNYLIIGFGSVRMFDSEMRKQKNGFEWDNTLKYKYNYLNFNMMFVGDMRNSWWHTSYEGLSGYGPHTLKDFINEKIKESGAIKTLFLGVSMGAYGAILFGCLNEATQVMAFSPQTFLTPERRKRQLNKAFGGFDVDESMTDLKDVLTASNNKKTIYKIWYGSQNKNDTFAANRLSGIYNVYIYPIDSKKHPVVAPVLKSGVFKREMNAFFGEI